MTDNATPSQEKLEPCPFCGAPGKEEKVWEGGPPTKLCEYYVCSSSACPANPVTTSAEDWNRRATPSRTDQPATMRSAEDLSRGFLQWHEALIHGKKRNHEGLNELRAMIRAIQQDALAFRPDAQAIRDLEDVLKDLEWEEEKHNDGCESDISKKLRLAINRLKGKP